MQMNHSFLKSASTLINNKLQLLINDDFSSSIELPTLLTPQPDSQRHSFLERAINEGLKVVLQLMPVNSDGYPVNVRGSVKEISEGRYLIQNRNVSYVVKFNQIRYIANL